MAFGDSVKKTFNLWYLWRRLKTWIGRLRDNKYTIAMAIENGGADGESNIPSATGALSPYMLEVLNAGELSISKIVQRWLKADEKLLPEVLKWKTLRALLRRDRQKLDAQIEAMQVDLAGARREQKEAEDYCKNSNHSHHSKFLFILTVFLVFGLDVALISKAAVMFAGSDIQAILFGIGLAGIFGVSAHVVGGLTANAWFPATINQQPLSASSGMDSLLAHITLENVFSFLSWGTGLFLSVLGLYAISCVRVEAFSTSDAHAAITLRPTNIGMLFFCLQLMFFAVAVFASMRDQKPEVAKCRENKKRKNKLAREFAALTKKLRSIDSRLPFFEGKYAVARERRNKLYAFLSEESREITLAASQNLAAYQRANNERRTDSSRLVFEATFLSFASREGCQLAEPTDEELLQGLVSSSSTTRDEEVM
jgi:hypothetical protein